MCILGFGGALYGSDKLVDTAQVKTEAYYTEVMKYQPILNGADLPTAIVSSSRLDESQWSDLRWLAQLIYSERTCSKEAAREELKAIGYTVLNRMDRKRWTMQEVITAKRAYSGVRKPGYVGWYGNPKPIHYQVAKELLESGVPNEWKGVEFFANMDIVKERNKKAYKWFTNELIPVKTFPAPYKGGGVHTFYRSK